MNKKEKIRDIENELRLVNLRIDCIEEHITHESVDELISLNTKKKKLEYEKFDLENGTFLGKVYALELQVSKQNCKYEEAKSRYEREKLLHNHKGMRKETRKMRMASNKVKKLVAYINLLDRIDDMKLSKNKARTL